jgi:hypothetical protein
VLPEVVAAVGTRVEVLMDGDPPWQRHRESHLFRRTGGLDRPHLTYGLPPLARKASRARSTSFARICSARWPSGVRHSTRLIGHIDVST